MCQTCDVGVCMCVSQLKRVSIVSMWSLCIEYVCIVYWIEVNLKILKTTLINRTRLRTCIMCVYSINMVFACVYECVYGVCLVSSVCV